MKPFTRIVIAALGVMMFTACGSLGKESTPVLPGENPYAAQPGDTGMMRSEVRIDSADVSLAKSKPPLAMLHFAYFQPTPCYSLRVETRQPDAQNQIQVTAYAVAERDKPCALMALATPLQADLSLGAYPKGHYSVWLNGAKVGEFDS
jgi:hypothetical protein